MGCLPYLQPRRRKSGRAKDFRSNLAAWVRLGFPHLSWLGTATWPFPITHAAYSSGRLGPQDSGPDPDGLGRLNVTAGAKSRFPPFPCFEVFVARQGVRYRRVGSPLRPAHEARNPGKRPTFAKAPSHQGAVFASLSLFPSFRTALLARGNSRPLNNSGLAFAPIRQPEEVAPGRSRFLEPRSWNFPGRRSDPDPG
jgi:hypothetical protein